MNIEESGCAPAAGCHRPQQLPASQLRPPHPVSATCVWPYLAAVTYTTTIAAHTYSTAAIAKTPALPGSWLYRGSHHRRRCCHLCLVCLVSPVGLSACVICPASSEIHGTSCLADDVVSAGISNFVSEEKLKRISNQCLTSVNASLYTDN